MRIHSPRRRAGVPSILPFEADAPNAVGDRLGEHVLDCAEMGLALVGAVTGCYVWPQSIWAFGGKVTIDKVIVHVGPTLPFLPRFLPNALHSRFCEQIRQAVPYPSSSKPS